MSNRLENPPACAPVQILLTLKADHWHKEIRRKQQKRSAKLRRSHTNDRVWPLIHFHTAAHHAGVLLKMAVPIGVAEHDVRSAARSMLIRGVEESPKIRLNLHYVEVVSAHL